MNANTLIVIVILIVVIINDPLVQVVQQHDRLIEDVPAQEAREGVRHEEVADGRLNQ